MYPEHHGIVANAFYDPARKQIYSYRDPAAEADGTWYGGTPLWVLAEQQGMRSACFFWPGSEADIQGVRPTYYMKYDAKYPNDQRVEQVLAWLKLPAEQRPHFITLYFSDVDSAGHAHGPDSPEVAAAVARVDKEIGRLAAGVAELNLPVDMVVLADHGMAKVDGDWINLDQYFDKSLMVTPVESFMYPRTRQAAAKIYRRARREERQIQGLSQREGAGGIAFRWESAGRRSGGGPYRTVFIAGERAGTGSRCNADAMHAARTACR